MRAIRSVAIACQPVNRCSKIARADINSSNIVGRINLIEETSFTRAPTVCPGLSSGDLDIIPVVRDSISDVGAIILVWSTTASAVALSVTRRRARAKVVGISLLEGFIDI